jgi:hypothetical protein
MKKMVKKTQTQAKKAGDEPGYLNKKKTDKKFYWTTLEGKARAKQMSEDMKKHGKLVTRTKGK